MKHYTTLLKGVSVGAIGALTLSSLVFAEDYGLSKTAKEAGLSTNGDVAGIIGNIIGSALSLITVLFFILVIYAGIRWMLARGDTGESKKALDTIVHAIIGIIIVISAYAITQFVFNAAGEVTQSPPASQGSGSGPSAFEPPDDTVPPPQEMACVPADVVVDDCEKNNELLGTEQQCQNKGANCAWDQTAQKCYVSQSFKDQCEVKSEILCKGTCKLVQYNA